MKRTPRRRELQGAAVSGETLLIRAGDEPVTADDLGWGVNASRLTVEWVPVRPLQHDGEPWGLASAEILDRRLSSGAVCPMTDTGTDTQTISTDTSTEPSADIRKDAALRSCSEDSPLATEPQSAAAVPGPGGQPVEQPECSWSRWPPYALTPAPRRFAARGSPLAQSMRHSSSCC